MLRGGTIRGIRRLIKLGSKMKSLPFNWNDKSGRLEIGSRKQRLVMTFIIIYMYSEAAYHTYRLVNGHMDKSVTLTKYIKLVELFVTRLTALMVQTITFVYYEDVKYFCNQLLNMKAGFVEIHGHKQERDTCSKTLGFWFWFVCIHPCITTTVYAVDNTDSRYWHGALLPNQVQPYFVPLFMLVEYWISQFAEVGCVFVGYIMLVYFRSTPIWMNELTTLVREKKTKCEQVITLYRAMLILNQAFNNAFRLILATALLASMVNLTVTLTCSLRLTPTMGLSGIQFPIAVLALIFAVDCTIRPSVNLTSPSTDFLAAFSEVTSVKRCGNKRRGYVANMEKERKKFMKMKRRDKAKTSQDLVNADALGERPITNRTPKASSSRSCDVLASTRCQQSQLASHFQVVQRGQSSREARKEDSIAAIETYEVGIQAGMSLEKKTALMLKATAKSMYPMVVKCFLFFEFEHSTIFNLYSTVLDQTISALLIT